MMRKCLAVMAVMLLSISVMAQAGDKKVFKKKFIKEISERTTMWQLKNPKHSPADWTNAAFYAGVYAAWQTTGSKDIYKALMDLGNSQNWKPHRRSWHADDVAISQVYLDLYKKEKQQKMIQPTIDSLDAHIYKPYPRRTATEVIKWWWCDALFMAPPALVKLGMITGNKAYLDSSDKLYKETYDLLYNKEEKLFARDNNFLVTPTHKGRVEANGQKIFWSRGNGWVLGGLVRMLEEFPSDYAERPFYENLYKEIATRVAGLQQPDGLWRASLLDPAAYPGGEVSGSGFFCYSLAWGINNGLLDKKVFLPVVKKSWIALVKCVNEEGRVGWVQPIGGSPQKNVNANSWEVYGTGAFLLAASEVIKLK